MCSSTNIDGTEQGQDYLEIIKAKLITEKPKKKVNISNLSFEDLQSIREHDIFLYYSIPVVRTAKILMKPLDMSSLGAQDTTSSLSGEEDEARHPPEVTVTRSTRITTEVHPDLLLEDLLNGEDDLDLEDTEDPLTRYLTAAHHAERHSFLS